MKKFLYCTISLLLIITLSSCINDNNASSTNRFQGYVQESKYVSANANAKFIYNQFNVFILNEDINEIEKFHGTISSNSDKFSSYLYNSVDDNLSGSYWAVEISDGKILYAFWSETNDSKDDIIGCYPKPDGEDLTEIIDWNSIINKVQK